MVEETWQTDVLRHVLWIGFVGSQTREGKLYPRPDIGFPFEYDTDGVLRTIANRRGRGSIRRQVYRV